MSNVVIKAEGLSKQYRLGQVGTGTLSHDINRLWHLARGKEDPYLKIGEENDRTSKGKNEYVWALKDVSFELGHGDILGIIGRNGAGKSTLLKILSRTTSPTVGNVKINGRIASLLEVGTGFHPELSGRDNIFLNGAILGMNRQEIKRKFDEIVNFAGVDRYIDTPVKRYSSGMYVRLAFAVAAHLDSEILIVDEVLAVGDAEFQKKCIGKMSEVGKGQGRTVLFVSHNMGSIRMLCNKGLFMENGRVRQIDDIEKVINAYANTSLDGNKVYYHKFSARTIKVSDVYLNGKKNAHVRVFEKIEVTVNMVCNSDVEHAEVFILIHNEDMNCVSGNFGRDAEAYTSMKAGENSISFSLTVSFHPGKHYLSVGFFDKDRNFIEWVELCESFDVDSFYSDGRIFQPRLGSTIAQIEWH